MQVTVSCHCCSHSWWSFATSIIFSPSSLLFHHGLTGQETTDSARITSSPSHEQDALAGWDITSFDRLGDRADEIISCPCCRAHIVFNTAFADDDTLDQFDASPEVHWIFFNDIHFNSSNRQAPSIAYVIVTNVLLLHPLVQIPLIHWVFKCTVLLQASPTLWTPGKWKCQFSSTQSSAPLDPNQPHTIYTTNGSTLPTFGTTIHHLHIRGHWFTASLLLTDAKCLLLNADFLQAHKLLVDFFGQRLLHPSLSSSIPCSSFSFLSSNFSLVKGSGPYLSLLPEYLPIYLLFSLYSLLQVLLPWSMVSFSEYQPVDCRSGPTLSPLPQKAVCEEFNILQTKSKDSLSSACVRFHPHDHATLALMSASAVLNISWPLVFSTAAAPLCTCWIPGGCSLPPWVL